MTEKFEKLLAEFMESEQYKDDSFHWSEMARAFYSKGALAGQSTSAARIAELESELDFQNQCRDGYRSERDMLKKDLEFAYKRAKVLADICKIPVHESPEVTGTILGLVRSNVERLESDCKAMAEAIMSDSVIRLVQLGDLNKAAEYEAKLASSLHHSG